MDAVLFVTRMYVQQNQSGSVMNVTLVLNGIAALFVEHLASMKLTIVESVAFRKRIETDVPK
jgi:hypothetical protein